MHVFAKIGLAGLALLGTGWSGGWFWFRQDVARLLDAEEARIAASGGTVSYDERRIGGFPFAYDIRYGEVRVTLPGGLALAAPWLSGTASAFDPGALALDLPPLLSATLPGRDAAPGVRVELASEAAQVVSRPVEGGALRHRLTAGSLRLSLAGAAAGTGTFEVQAEAPALDIVTGPAPGRVTAALAAELASLTLPAADPGASPLRLTLVGADLGTALDLEGEAALADWLSGRRDLAVTLRAENLAAETAAQTSLGAATLRLAAAAEEGRLVIHDGMLDLAMALRGLGADLAPLEPLPGLPDLEAAAEGADLRLSLPFMRGTLPSPFALRIAVAGFTASEDAWAVLDPGARISRDPALLDLDLAGEAIWTADPAELLEPGGAGGRQLLELPALDLRGLRLRLAGAEVTATGSGTRRTDPATGAPLHEARLSLRGEGLRALLASLAAAGLVTREQVLLANGLMGAYARSEGPDSLATEILLGPDGVTVNGLRLQAAALPPAAPEAPAPAAPAPEAPAPEPPAAVPAEPAPEAPTPAPAPAEPSPAPAPPRQP